MDAIKNKVAKELETLHFQRKEALKRMELLSVVAIDYRLNKMAKLKDHPQKLDFFIRFNPTIW